MPRQRFLLTGTYQLPFGTGREWSQQEQVRQRGIGRLEYQHGHADPDRAFPHAHHQPHRGSVEHRHHRTGRHHCAARRSGKSELSRSAAILWNINAFAPTPAGAGRIGNAGVGILEGPGTIAVSAGLSKIFPVRERLRFRFEATFTNALNHTNFAPPAADISSPSTFGVLQSAQTAGQGGNRTGQLALRMDF